MTNLGPSAVLELSLGSSPASSSAGRTATLAAVDLEEELPRRLRIPPDRRAPPASIHSSGSAESISAGEPLMPTRM
jgi:hypothetical protein